MITTILGPLFFLLHTNDLKDLANNCFIHQFADETQLYPSFTDTFAQNSIENISYTLEKIHEYSTNHSLKLNPTKSQLRFFGDKHSVPVNHIINIDGIIIDLKDTLKSFGLYILLIIKYTCICPYRDHRDQVETRTFYR